MSETTEYVIGGLQCWQDSDGTWWYRDASGRQHVATLTMMPYLEALAAARREVETVTRERDEARAALEDVRQWAMLNTRPCVAIGCTKCPRCSLFVILNRALAQEAGDDTR